MNGFVKLIFLGFWFYLIPFLVSIFIFFFYNLFCVVRSSLDDKLLGGLGMMHDGTADRPGEAIPTNAPDAVNYFPNQNPRDIKKN